MLPDEEGFLQPVVDVAKCVQCGKCEAVCPVLHPGLPRTPLATYAAKAKDDELRKISSSGGVFSLLARQMIAKGGTVYGAAFEKGTHRVIHQDARNEEELDALRGSKYVQSDMGDTFAAVKSELEAGKEVLFSGCPCQVAGLKNFLGKDCENLLTVEVICHAVPSPLVWRKFLEAQELAVRKKIVRIIPRRNCNWRSFAVEIEFEADEQGVSIRKFPIWYSVFFKELCNRRGCYDCRMREFRSGADIAIGDFWGIENAIPSFEDELGVSSVAVCSEKGISEFEKVLGELSLEKVTLRQMCRKNKAILGVERIAKHRQRFFEELIHHDFNALAHELTDPPKWFVFLRTMKRRILGRPLE